MFAVDLAKKLLSFPSITPHDAGCQAFIRDYLTPLGFHCETLQYDNVTNLYARIGSAAPLLVFAGHTDVVPPGPIREWSSGPFEPVIRDNKLFGRGAVDM